MEPRKYLYPYCGTESGSGSEHAQSASSDEESKSSEIVQMQMQMQMQSNNRSNRNTDNHEGISLQSQCGADAACTASPRASNPFELTQSSHQSLESPSSTRTGSGDSKVNARKSNRSAFSTRINSNGQVDVGTATRTTPTTPTTRTGTRMNMNMVQDLGTDHSQNETGDCSDSDHSSSTISQSQPGNPFELLQQQIMNDENRRNHKQHQGNQVEPNSESYATDLDTAKRTRTRTRTERPSSKSSGCINERLQLRQSTESETHMQPKINSGNGTRTTCTSTFSRTVEMETPQPPPTQQDWPVPAYDFSDDEYQQDPLPDQQIQLPAKPKRRQSAPSPKAEALRDTELEKNRKRLRRSKDWTRSIHNQNVTPGDGRGHHTATRTCTGLSAPMTLTHTPQSTKTDHPSQAKIPIVGTRPQHWGSTMPVRRGTRSRSNNRTGRFSLSAASQNLSAFVTPSPFATTRASQLALVAKKQAPFSFSGQTPQRPNSPTTAKCFTPAFLSSATPSTDKENEMNEEPWYHATKPLKRSKSNTPKKKAGPLLQRLSKLRASLNADNVRLHSRMSIQDPRQDKVYMDVHLEGDPAQHGTHTIAVGNIGDGDDAKLAWIVFADKKILGQHLRIYNPIPLQIPNPTSRITHVVICTQFHEPIPSNQA